VNIFQAKKRPRLLELKSF